MDRNEINAGLERLDKGFMKPEITEKTTWYEVNGPYGTEWVEHSNIGDLEDSSVYLNTDSLQPIPSELRDYCENTEFWTLSLVEGYGARLSAPGYMDCTEMCVFPTLAEAEEYLVEMYDDGWDDYDDDDDSFGERSMR